jgi:hypothetical protein
MTTLSDDSLDVVERLIDEGEARRIEQIQIIAHLTESGQSTDAATHALQEIEDTLAALRCRWEYLQAMQEKP